LDTIYAGVQKIRSAQSNAVFPKLSVHWSPNNTSTGTRNIPLGQIGTSFFETSTSAAGTKRSIYVLGKADNDSDEFDAHVVAHEFGHYLQDAFTRDDSPGGRHGGSNDRLDMRVAFSEGWGNGWAAIALANKLYSDTAVAGEAQGFSMDVSLGESSNPGWFKERSVQRLFWDMNASSSIGFAPIWTAMRTGLVSTPALTSIHSFARALVQSNPSAAPALSAIFLTQSIAVPTDAYGGGETNFGDPVVSNVNPLYLVYPALGTTLTNLCVSNVADPGRDANKLGEYRYVRLTLPAGNRRITVTRSASTTLVLTTDPDFYLYGTQGRLTNGVATFGETAVFESESAQINLLGGDYVLAITDYQFTSAPALRQFCFDLVVN
jgi:hypothetical protein